MPSIQGDRSPSPSHDGLITDNTQQQQAPFWPHPGQTPYPSFHGPPSSSFPPSLHSSDNIPHQTPNYYYGPRSEYGSPSYPPLNPPGSSVGQNPPLVGFPSSFHDSRVTEGRMSSESPHAQYQPMLQPHVPVYYQPHAAGSNRGHFQPIHHYSPHSPSHYSFPRSFPASPPVYQLYPSHQQADTQGAWYYLPHPPQQHVDGTTALTHFHPYPSITPLKIDNNNPALPSSQEPGARHRPGPQDPLPSDQPRNTPALWPFNKSETSSQSVDQSDAGATSTSRRQDKPIVRKPYHPNPPPHRSEFVMWVGNVPSDATHDELWKFFNQPPKSPSSGTSSTPDDSIPTQRSLADQQQTSGVISIFLISKSSCVFVNYKTQRQLSRAIESFNGKPLRSQDPRCLRLVCRVRKRDDDLKAGVGGQRGQGLHVKWIKDQKMKGKLVQSDAPASARISHSQASGSSPLDDVDKLIAQTSDLTFSSDNEGPGKYSASQRSSLGSFSSTDSSILSTYFPKRYFILKSLTQYDLDISVRHGLWATQKHNEGVLDQAYRTSKDVYLIFGVNKSGEFYGYARMAGPVQHGAKNVLWASRARNFVGASPSPMSPSQIISLDLASQSSSMISNTTRPTPNTSTTVPEDAEIWGDVRTPGLGTDLSSAPAELGKPHTPASTGQPLQKSASLPGAQKTFELDPRAPIRAIRKSGGPPGPNSSLVLVEEEPVQDDEAGSQQGEIDTWGDCFRVEWLCTERLPFQWTKNLRNPWNHDREVKISRDGTELEPSVGDLLLNAWEVMKTESTERRDSPSNPADNYNGLRRPGQIRRHSAGGRPVTE